MADHPQTDARTIRQFEDERYQAMLAGDADALDRLLDSALVYTHSSGVADSKASYISGVRARRWAYRTIDRSEESIVTRPGVALVFNRLRIAIDISGTPRELDNRALAVWTPHEAGAWRLLALHSTAIPAAPAG